MALLNIDYVSIFGAEGGVNSSNTAAMNESSEKVNDSISFINLNPPLISGDPTLMRRINKLNSLRSISK